MRLQKTAYVAPGALERVEQVGNDPRVVLVVGMDHHDDVGAPLERRPVARLLVCPVAPVARVDDDVDPETARDLDRPVPGRVVHEDDVVHEVLRDVVVRLLEGPLRVVSGHDDGDAQHRAYTPRRVRITLRVRRRMDRSSPKDQLFK